MSYNYTKWYVQQPNISSTHPTLLLLLLFLVSYNANVHFNRLVLRLLNFVTRTRLSLRSNLPVSRRSSPSSVSSSLPRVSSPPRSLRLESPLPESWPSSTSLRESSSVSSTRTRSTSPRISVPSRPELSDEDSLLLRLRLRLSSSRRLRRLSPRESTLSRLKYVLCVIIKAR